MAARLRPEPPDEVDGPRQRSRQVSPTLAEKQRGQGQESLGGKHVGGWEDARVGGQWVTEDL